MSAYKQFLSTDVIVAPLVVNKSFSFEGSASFTTNGIELYLGANYTSSNLSSSSLDLSSSSSSSSSFSSSLLFVLVSI